MVLSKIFASRLHFFAVPIPNGLIEESNFKLYAFLSAKDVELPLTFTVPEFETSVVLPSAPFIIKEAFTFVFVVSVYKLISFVFVSLDEFIKICGIPLSYAVVFPLYVNVVSLEAGDVTVVSPFL